jgi:hypothetical protein
MGSQLWPAMTSLGHLTLVRPARRMSWFWRKLLLERSEAATSPRMSEVPRNLPSRDRRTMAGVRGHSRLRIPLLAREPGDESALD